MDVGKVNEYGQWTMIDAPSTDQESLAREPLAAEPAGKAPSCDDVVIFNGLLGRGAFVCNTAWLDRPGSLAILAGARQ
jgi:hypothetical protein